MIRGLLKSVGLAKSSPPSTRVIRAFFDSAKTTTRNARKWAGASGVSADAAADVEARRVLRNRSRYIVSNSSIAAGIIDTYANDVIGTGPRLQMTGEISSKDARRVEREFARWSEAVSLGQKLSIAVQSLVTSGEVFVLLASNPGVKNAVVFDLRLVEADQVASPYEDAMTSIFDDGVDGIVYDIYGNPTAYSVLRDHPGSNTLTGRFLEAAKIPADRVIHLYKPTRPGQSRGVPWITPALDRFNALDAFVQATVDAAETSARLPMFIYSDQAAEDGEGVDPDANEVIELQPGEALTLPAGWKVGQLKQEHPTTTFPAFRAEIIKDVARCLGMPLNIAAGDSSGYNYSSGRLDHQTYYKAIGVVQKMIERIVLNRVFDRWLSIATLVDGLLPQSLRTTNADTDHSWFWDGVGHVDPLKEANAERVRLESGTGTLSEIYARQGKDWETQLEQRARERDKLEELGLLGPSFEDEGVGADDPEEEEEVSDE